MGSIRSFFARVAGRIVQFFALVLGFLVSALFVYLLGLVVSSFPCLATYCIVLAFGVTMPVTWVWLILGALLWVIFEIFLIVGYSKKKRELAQDAARMAEQPPVQEKEPAPGD